MSRRTTNKTVTGEEAHSFSDDQSRRKSGAFYTPSIWARQMFIQAELALNRDFSSNCVVWDASCGSLNLTKDFKFRRLYASTLFQSEVDTFIDRNPEATHFQFDFLNNNWNLLPESLLAHLKNQDPFVMYMNPPYVGSQSSTASSGNQDIKRAMKNDGLGSSSSNLYTQFIYRSIQLAR